MHDILAWTWEGNTVTDWLRLFAVFTVVAFLLGLTRWLVVRRLSIVAARSATWIDDIVVDVVRLTKNWFIVTVALAIGLEGLVLPPGVGAIVHDVVIVVVMLQVAIWANGVIRFSVVHFRRNRGGDGASVATVQGFAFLGRIALGVVLIIVTLDLLGVKVTTLVAGLGITGVAIALAVQNILGDLFAALAIVLDKPFVVGDAIAVDDINGNVEHVGLKMTRVRSLGGEQVVISNADLLRSRIHNYRRLAERRVVLKFALQLDTDPAIAMRIPALLKEIVERQQPVRFDRAHLAKIGEWSLEYEVVYFVTTPDYLAHMNVQQAINLVCSSACAPNRPRWRRSTVRRQR